MTSTPLPGEELRGRALGGRYRMVRLLGRGGMGAVWVARDEQGDTDVAVKVVKAALLDDQAALTRFRREMAVMAELSHDNIVRGLAAGEDDGVLWLAMELLHGQTLRERLDARGRMPWQESLDVVRQIARGLGAAHLAGVVHRDLKPENIMLMPTEEGGTRVKLLDFGVAKATTVDGGVSSMTGTGFIVGTPGYVAPEVVLEGKTNDPRSDFYALGVLWYEMVTGQKPFTAKTAFALAMRHAHEKPPAFNEVAPFAPVPAPVEAVVGRLMAKKPEERPPDTASLLVLVEGLERAAAAAASGTPVPEAFDATLTDVRETPNGTAVVPIRLSPTPAPALATPATGLASGSSAAPSDLHLFRQLPIRMKVAVVAGAVLLPLVALGVVAAVVRGQRGGDPSGGGEAAATAAERVAELSSPDANSSVAQDHARQAAPAPHHDVVSVEGTKPPEAAPAPDAGVVAYGRRALADQRAPKPGKSDPPRSAPPSNPPAAHGTTGYGTWNLSAPGYKVKVVVDGKPYQDPPITNELLPVGPHELVLLDGDTGQVLVSRSFTIVADQVFKFTYRPDAP